MVSRRSVDGFVRCYDLRMGKLRSDQMHSPVTHVSLSNDGNCVLVSCLNNTVRLLAKEDGQLFRTYEVDLMQHPAGTHGGGGRD